MTISRIFLPRWDLAVEFRAPATKVVLLATALVAALYGCSQDVRVLLQSSRGTPIGFEFSPGGGVLAVRTGLSELSLVSTASWGIKKCPIRTRAFTFVDSELAAIIGDDGRLYMVDARTGRSVSSFQIPGHTVGNLAACNGCICVPVASGDSSTGSSTMLVMDQQGKMLKKFPTLSMSASPAERPVTASRDGKWLVVLGWDRAIVYRASKWQKAADIRGGFAEGYLGGFLTQSAFSSDGKLLLLGNEGFLKIFDTRTWKGNALHPHPGHLIQAILPNPSNIGFLVLLHDGSLRDASDTLTRVVAGPSNGSAGYCIAAALGPRGTLVTGWENGEIRRQVVLSN